MHVMYNIYIPNIPHMPHIMSILLLKFPPVKFTVQ